MLWTDADGHLAPRLELTIARKRMLDRSKIDLEAASVPANDTWNEVHRRRADEARDELVGGRVVELERLALLLDHTLAHDDDVVGHGHRLDLVVGDVNGGRAQLVVQRADFPCA